MHILHVYMQTPMHKCVYLCIYSTTVSVCGAQPQVVAVYQRLIYISWPDHIWVIYMRLERDQLTCSIQRKCLHTGKKQGDKECGGGRLRRGKVFLMYSFGPASITRQHSSAFSGLFPVTAFHQ